LREWSSARVRPGSPASAQPASPAAPRVTSAGRSVGRSVGQAAQALPALLSRPRGRGPHLDSRLTWADMAAGKGVQRREHPRGSGSAGGGGGATAAAPAHKDWRTPDPGNLIGHVGGRDCETDGFHPG